MNICHFSCISQHSALKFGSGKENVHMNLLHLPDFQNFNRGKRYVKKITLLGFQPILPSWWQLRGVPCLIGHHLYLHNTTLHSGQQLTGHLGKLLLKDLFVNFLARIFHGFAVLLQLLIFLKVHSTILQHWLFSFCYCSRKMFH